MPFPLSSSFLSPLSLRLVANTHICSFLLAASCFAVQSMLTCVLEQTSEATVPVDGWTSSTRRFCAWAFVFFLFKIIPLMAF
jgi:hypothetical protein